MKSKEFFRLSRSFTLIELLIVIGIIAVLVAIAVVAINPARQFAKTNNAVRFADTNTVLNAISQNVVDGRGIFNSTGCEGPIPTVVAPIAFDDPAITTDDANYDICGCLVPTYIGSMPVDPTDGSYTSCTAYDTGYTVVKDATTGRVTIVAPGAQSENGAAPIISVTR